MSSGRSALAGPFQGRRTVALPCDVSGRAQHKKESRGRGSGLERHERGPPSPVVEKAGHLVLDLEKALRRWHASCAADG